MLLGKNQSERDQIYDFIIKTFEIRNKIVHGDNVKTPINIRGQEYTLSSLLEELQEYVQESLSKLIG
jgi:translation initiation factor IF-3